MSDYDLVLSDGLVVDGSGAAPFQADLAVHNGKIVDIGDLADIACSKRVSAKGRCVAPGFIDAHTHDDRVLLSAPDMSCKLSQGVTTVVTGNCGISLAPLQNTEPPPPLNLIGGKKWYRFKTTAEYVSELQNSPASVNCAMLVGHSTLRVGVMDRLDRAATKKETLQMEKLVDLAMQAGAIGFSTGLEYPPAICASEQEVIQLTTRAAKAGGIYTTHMRNEADEVHLSIEETVRVADQANIPTVISHHKAGGRKNWGRTKDTLAQIKQAQKSVKLNFDVYPYVASSTALLPQFVEKSERVLITWSDSHPECTGMDLDEICKQWDVSLDEAIESLLPAGAIYFQMSDEDLHRVLQYPGAMIGSDGIPSDKFPHPRLWGTFPRVIGHYCRELGILSIEDAIARMTGNTAETFGIKDRGYIRKGMIADLVVFDLEQIIDKANFQNPIQSAEGIDSVYVNGSMAYSDRQWTGARTGQVI